MKIKIFTVAWDTDYGTGSEVMFSEQDQRNWFLKEFQDSMSEKEVEDFRSGKTEIIDLIENHKDYLDTYNWDEFIADVPSSAIVSEAA